MLGVCSAFQPSRLNTLIKFPHRRWAVAVKVIFSRRHLRPRRSLCALEYCSSSASSSSGSLPSLPSDSSGPASSTTDEDEERDHESSSDSNAAAATAANNQRGEASCEPSAVDLSTAESRPAWGNTSRQSSPETMAMHSRKGECSVRLSILVFWRTFVMHELACLFENKGEEFHLGLDRLGRETLEWEEEEANSGAADDS